MKPQFLTLTLILAAPLCALAAPVKTPPAKSTLPAATLGAKVFVKYYWTSYPRLTINRGYLLLFPDGTAFDDIPSKKVPDFSAATLRKNLDASDIGRWKKQGKNLVLTFGTKKAATLTTHPKGWLDASRAMEMKGAYNIYFPVNTTPRANFLGVWHEENFASYGTAGGSAPLVAGGSKTGWNFRPDGTFSASKDSYSFATTSNMGTAYNSGSNVTTSDQNQSQLTGRWRLDGPLLTLEQNGKRSVLLAFVLPEWGKDKKNPDLCVDGDVWTRKPRQK